MNVFLINPNWNLHNNVFTATITQPVYPLELLYTATMLSDTCCVGIYDAHLKNASNDELKKELIRFNPDIVVIETAPTYLFWRCCPLDIDLPARTVEIVKRSTTAKIILIGPHPSSSPSWALEKTRADFLIRGEFELSVASFIKSQCTNFQVPGLFTHSIENGQATVENLSDLPEIDFSFIEPLKYPLYLYESKGSQIVPVKPENELYGASVESSRGCPYSCPYCFKQHFRDKFRRRPLDKIIAEIIQLNKQGINFINFIDEIFNLPNSHTRELCKELRKCNIQFGCQCRPDIMTEETLYQMVDAGCIHIEYGLESFDVSSLESIGKNTSIEHALNIIEKTKTMIPYTAVFMLDFDNITLEQKPKINKSFYFKKCEVSPARPYPGTLLYTNLLNNLKISVPEENQWEFVQKYVWHLGRVYRWIPLKLFLNLPFYFLLITTTVFRKIALLLSRRR